jgi:Bacteriophage tail sheath protein
MPMSAYRTPGVYVQEVAAGPRPITAVGTSTAVFIGDAPRAKALVNQARAVNNWSEFVARFMPEEEKDRKSTVLSNAVYGFFENGGTRCFIVNTGGEAGVDDALAAAGIEDEIAIVVAPGRSDPATHSALLTHCERFEDRVAILDTPEEVDDITLLTQVETAPAPGPSREGSAAGGRARTQRSGEEAGRAGGAGDQAPKEGGLRPPQSDRGFGTVYFPWITVMDPISDTLVNVPPSGHMAGIWARTDAMRGVHKAPANEIVNGALNLTYRLTRDEQALLNDAGVNCIRLFARSGIRVWGARTLADAASEWRYLNVRRLFNMVEESIVEGTNWIVFEPNDRTLWKSIRRDIGAFLTRVWRDGALMGATPEQAFFVKCDEETNPPDVIDAGQVVAIVGLAPVKPAEFVVFQVMQSASGAQVSPV